MYQWWKWVVGLAVLCSIPVLLCVLTGKTLDSTRAEAATTRGKYAWPNWTSTPGTKIVPIVSAGTPGLRLGLAQVSGPKTLVTRVQAVLQLDADFKSVRVKMLVPSDSLTSLRRVQGTAVTAVLQYELMDFSKKKAQPTVQQSQGRVPKAKPCPPQRDNGKHKGWDKHKQAHSNGHDCEGGR